MNGVHDMGGMHGMGPIEHETNEPVFHAAWEGRIYALTRVLRAGGGRSNLDSSRHAIEVLPPAEYLRMSYYERWVARMLRQIVSTGLATEAEVESGEPDDGSHYYDHWLAALEHLVQAKGLLDHGALVERKEAWADAYRHTPHGKPIELRHGPGPDGH